MGVQVTHWRKAEKNMARFIEMMQNQVSFLIQPSVMSSRVMPNDVLLQTALVTEKVPATVVGSIIACMFSRGKSQMCSP